MKDLKYTKYSCVFQHRIQTKISRSLPNNKFLKSSWVAFSKATEIGFYKEKNISGDCRRCFYFRRSDSRIARGTEIIPQER